MNALQRYLTGIISILSLLFGEVVAAAESCREVSCDYQEGIYRAERAASIRAYPANRLRTERERETIVIQIPKEEYFGLKDFKVEEDLGPSALMDVSLDPANPEAVESFRVQLKNLKSVGPRYSMVGDLAILQSIMISNDETDEVGRARIKITKPEFVTHCFANVKKYLLQKHLVDERLKGGSAWMAGRDLVQRGFEKIEGGPAATEVNDICVYRGGWHKHGHVEVRVEKGWWYGYGIKPKPVVGRNLIGCYRKTS
jgi:hypothetical protein